MVGKIELEDNKVLKKKVGAVVLAAGYGQINSGHPKVLETFNHKRLIQYPVDELIALEMDPVVVVNNGQNGFGNQIVCTLTEVYSGMSYAWQNGRRGPADAFRCSVPALRTDGCTEAVVLFGDMPFVSRWHVSDLLKRHLEVENKLTFSSWQFDPAHSLAHRMDGYAYLDRSSECGSPCGFPFVRKYCGFPEAGMEVLSSVYVVNLDWFESIFDSIPTEDKGDGYTAERHLPNLVELAAYARAQVTNLRLIDHDVHEIVGVNTAEDWKELVAFAATHQHKNSGGRP